MYHIWLWLALFEAGDFGYVEVQMGNRDVGTFKTLAIYSIGSVFFQNSSIKTHIILEILTFVQTPYPVSGYILGALKTILKSIQCSSPDLIYSCWQACPGMA